MKKLLVVDDAIFIRLMVKDALKGEFEVVAETDTAEESISLYEKLKPDVVTMDISLAGAMNGIEALKQIRANDPSARVIMVSAMGDQANIKASIELGAYDFIVKPFSKDQLKKTVQLAGG
ncbi:MAG: response regulator [Turneriella sp.]